MNVSIVVLNSIWYDPRVRKQISEYLSNGINVSCVGLKCTRYSESDVNRIPCNVKIVELDNKYIGAQKGVLRKLERERKIIKEISNEIIAQQPDIIHANDLNALIPAYIASKKINCKLIYDSHEIFTDNFVGKKLYAYYLKLQEKRIIKNVDKVICVSNAAAEYFCSKYRIQDILVVTNCSLLSDCVARNEDHQMFEILNHGQFYEGRGYDIMVEASKYLNSYLDIRLILRGFGHMEQWLKDRVKCLETNNVFFYPPVKVDELIEKASFSNVGVAITEPICLNFKLSISNKIFEYASAGLPVIMSDIPEHRYLNDKYNFGIILEENTPEAFANAVIKLYSDKDFYKQCAQNACKLSREINWEKEFKKLIDYEKSIIQE